MSRRLLTHRVRIRHWEQNRGCGLPPIPPHPPPSPVQRGARGGGGEDTPRSPDAFLFEVGAGGDHGGHNHPPVGPPRARHPAGHHPRQNGIGARKRGARGPPRRAPSLPPPPRQSRLDDCRGGGVASRAPARLARRPPLVSGPRAAPRHGRSTGRRAGPSAPPPHKRKRMSACGRGAVSASAGRGVRAGPGSARGGAGERPGPRRDRRLAGAPSAAGRPAVENPGAGPLRRKRACRLVAPSREQADVKSQRRPTTGARGDATAADEFG